MESLSFDPDAQSGLVAFLEHELGSAGPCKRIDTHAASIFIAGERAWKLKRAVRYPYLDFSTPSLRRAALEAELRLNRRTAPNLYLNVHPIVRTPSGFQIGGDGEPVDWLLEMRRFGDDARLDIVAQKHGLDEQLLICLADRVHSFHEAARPVIRSQGAEDIRQVIDGNAVSFAPFERLFGRPRISKLIENQHNLCAHHKGLLDTRARDGRVRRAHGDLHLANIALIDGEAVPFDCLEFNEDLATIDILYDLAFLLMDLWHRGLRSGANLVFNRYIDVSGDEEGVRLLQLFLSLRATVRAHVLASTAERTGRKEDVAEALQFLDLAEAVLEPGTVALVGIGGLSGSGKSAVAKAIAADFGGAPGARILRTDILRKRIAGVAPETKLPESFYTPLANRTVYGLLTNRARRNLAAGIFTIADAVFSDPDERTRIARIADHERVPFVGCWLETSEANRLARVSDRPKDPSDADEKIVKIQSARRTLSPPDWHRIAADASLAVVAECTSKRINQALNNDTPTKMSPNAGRPVRVK
jgi:aminoglycoside phosphotransferase family enzyme/predicted kinase